MTTGSGSYSEETKRRAAGFESKKLMEVILRNERRADHIIKAVRAGLHAYANSTRGERTLGVKCSVSMEHRDVVMKCKDGTVFKIGFK
jgi:hypothetical protein